MKITHKGSKKLGYWHSPMGRAHDRAFWRGLACAMFGG